MRKGNVQIYKVKFFECNRSFTRPLKKLLNYIGALLKREAGQFTHRKSQGNAHMPKKLKRGTDVDQRFIA